MKKIIFIISITLLAFNSQAQGTLQFNQVLTFTQDTSFSSGGFSNSSYETIDIYTIPTSRVVKITKAINRQSNTNNGCNNNSFYFTINGIKTTEGLLEGSWLKEGDIIGFSSELDSGSDSWSYCNQYDQIFVSLIEYNIIQE